MKTRLALLLVVFLTLTAFAPPRSVSAQNPEEYVRGKARINALDFGVVLGDETVDNTAALQRALDAAGENGGAVVELPSGRFRFDGSLSIPTGVTLQGTYRVPPTVVNKDEKPTGTTLLAYANRNNPEGEPFVNLKGSNSALVGVVVTYPEWEAVAPPTPYPPCVASENTCNVAVIDCCLLNPYEGIRFVRAHRHLVRNITGYPSWRGFFVDECYDIGHMENVHFWPFGVTYKPDDPYCEWVNINGTAFEFARTDWHYVSNTFCFGYGRGYYFSDHGHGGANGNFLGIGADSCRRAVFVEQSQKQGLLVTNGEFVGRWTSEDSVCLEIGEENDGAVMLSNCAFWGPVKTCVLSKNETGRVTLNGCEFVNWDEVHSRETKGGSPAVEILAGRATLQGCSFEQSGTHLKIGDGATFVTAIGNQAPGGFRALGDRSPMKTQFAANELDPLECQPKAKGSYFAAIGAAGDSRFIRYWYGPEKSPAGTFRWSSDRSQLVLPVVKDGGEVTVAIKIQAPGEAIASEGEEAPTPGVYLGDELLAEIKTGLNELVLKIDPTKAELTQDDEIVLEIRCKTWLPLETRGGSTDERRLGVQCFSVQTTSETSAEKPIFDANVGKFVDE